MTVFSHYEMTLLSNIKVFWNCWVAFIEAATEHLRSLPGNLNLNYSDNDVDYHTFHFVWKIKAIINKAKIIHKKVLFK